MKKLLTLLLTFVMVIFIVNLNSNFTKAEGGENDQVDYTLNLQIDGTIKDSNGNIVTFPGKLYYQNGAWYMNNFSFNTTSIGSAIKFNTDTVLIISGTNNIISNNSFNHIGISVDHDLTIKSSSGTKVPSISIDTSGPSLSMNGSNTLKIESGTVKLVSKRRPLAVTHLYVCNNSVLEVSATTNDSDFDALKTQNLNIEGNGSLKATSSDPSGGYAVVTDQFITDPNNEYELLGTSDGTTTDPQKVIYDTANHQFLIDGTTNQAKYLTITAKEQPKPEPTPSPSKKDESCEKVIGPTWHWNNDKGICEDYGVVGTSTR